MASNTEDDRRFDVERLKIRIDTVKHTTTLATGTVVILAGLFDKLPKPLIAPQMLQASFISMSCCILLSFIYLFRNAWVRVRPERELSFYNLVISFLIFALFVLGVMTLGVFAVVNIAHFKT